MEPDRRRTVSMLLAAGAATTLVGCSSAVAADRTPPVATLGALSVIDAYVPQPASPDVAAVYFTVTNSGGAADALVAVASDAGGTASLHRTQGGAMVPLNRLAIPAHGRASLTPGGSHVMLENPTRALTKGGSVRLTLTFASAGTVTVTVPVTSYRTDATPDAGDVVKRLVAAAGCLLVLAGCSSTGSGGSGAPVSVVTSAPAGGLDGSTLDTGVAKPVVTLTDTSGQPYDLATATKGRLTLLYFGYTHCPDVCPTTMADISSALTQVPAQVRNHTTVVFVTSDPARDTGPVIRQWLDTFDRSFVGLTGTVDQVDAAAAAVGVSIEPPVTQPDGSISVTHGAQVLAFSPTDDVAHVVYTAGSDAAAYEHDLPLLAAGKQ